MLITCTPAMVMFVQAPARNEKGRPRPLTRLMVAQNWVQGLSETPFRDCSKRKMNMCRQVASRTQTKRRNHFEYVNLLKDQARMAGVPFIYIAKMFA